MASSPASSVEEIVLSATPSPSLGVQSNGSEYSNIEVVVLPQTPLTSFNTEFNGFKYNNPSDLELAISLELLSCIQSEQIIPIQRICDVVMPALLHYLSKGNGMGSISNVSNVDDNSGSSNIQNSSSDMHALFLKIQRDIQTAEENLERLKQWEETLDHFIKDLLVRDWDWEGKLSDRTAGNAGDLSVHSRKLYEALCEIDATVTNLRQHIEPPCNAISIKPADDHAQSSTSIVSATEQQSLDQSFNVDFSGTVPSHDFQARYDSLNQQLKNCLLYFSAFPANSKIRKKALTYLWIGERFIDPTTLEDLSSEEIAAIYFEELFTKGFIEPVDEKDPGDFSSCKMTPSIHSAVVLHAKNSDFFDFDARGKPTTNYIRSGRACLSRTEGGYQEQLIGHVDDINRHWLSTLFNLDETFPEFPAGWFSKMNNVTTLCLGSWQSSKKTSVLVENAEFLKDLHHLKLLRCLSLNRMYNIKKLPKSICKLFDLRILDLKKCYDLKKLPGSIGLLQNLTHLDMSECYLIDHMPKGLSMLVKLVVLKGFVISDVPTARGKCTLEDLVKLKKLKKLSIYTNSSGKEGQLNHLSQFMALQVLTISWTRASSGKVASLKTYKSKRQAKVEVITPSSLPASLEKLDLRGWPSTAMPPWVNPLELHKLNKLYFRGGNLCDLCQQMSHPYQWTVKILRLQYLKKLEMNWQEVRQLFPKLVYLDKIDCPMLVSFPADREWRANDNRLEEGIHGAGNA